MFDNFFAHLQQIGVSIEKYDFALSFVGYSILKITICSFSNQETLKSCVVKQTRKELEFFDEQQMTPCVKGVCAPATKC